MIKIPREKKINIPDVASIFCKKDKIQATDFEDNPIKPDPERWICKLKRPKDKVTDLFKEVMVVGGADFLKFGNLRSMQQDLFNKVRVWFKQPSTCSVNWTKGNAPKYGADIIKLECKKI